MPTLYMMIGISSSGKSTWRKSYIPEADLISPDAVLEERFGDALARSWSPVVAGEAWKTSYQKLGRKIVEEALGDGTQEYVWDAMFLTPRDRSAILSIAKGAGWKVIAVYMNTPLATCLERLALRKDRGIKPQDMERNFRILTPPRKDEGFDEILWIENGEMK
jgi:predicted kinase